MIDELNTLLALMRHDQHGQCDNPNRVISDYADRLEAIIRKSGSSATPVLESWKLVPVEPTTEMVEAFYRAYERPLSPHRWESRFSNAWEAFLAAAPKPDGEEA